MKEKVYELDIKYRDHALVNNLRFKDCRECHIEPDWVLIYSIDHDELRLCALRTGTHLDTGLQKESEDLE